MNKELNLLNSRKKYVVSRMNDIIQTGDINSVLIKELRSLIEEYRVLQQTINDLPHKKPKQQKILKYPHEFYRDKMELFFSNS